MFAEFWDIGGSRRFESSRALFYSGADALLLVHDLGNQRSYRNLKTWLREVTGHLEPTSGGALSWSAAADGGGGADADDFASAADGADDVLQLEFGGSTSLPVLIVGNKLDLVMGTARMDEEASGATDGVSVSALDREAFAPGSPGGLALARFLDRVVEHARKRRREQTGSPLLGRRTPGRSPPGTPASPPSLFSGLVSPSLADRSPRIDDFSDDFARIDDDTPVNSNWRQRSKDD